MKNINKFLMLSLLTSVAFIQCKNSGSSTTTTPTVISPVTVPYSSGTTDAYSIELNSAGTAYVINKNKKGTTNVWTNTLTTPVQLVTTIGSATAKPATQTLAAGATATMTGLVFSATVSQANNAATKKATPAGAGGGKGGAGSSTGLGGGASAGGLAAAKQSKTTTT